MFKDTPDGQTYHDPEAERKAREPMQDLIKESANEFEEICRKGLIENASIDTDEVLDWHTKQMEKAYEKGKTNLLNALIEREEKEKKKVIPNMLQDDELYQERGMDGIKAHNQAKTDTINHLKSLRDSI